MPSVACNMTSGVLVIPLCHYSLTIAFLQLKRRATILYDIVDHCCDCIHTYNRGPVFRVPSPLSFATHERCFRRYQFSPCTPHRFVNKSCPIVNIYAHVTLYASLSISFDNNFLWDIHTLPVRYSFTLFFCLNSMFARQLPV